MTAPTRTHPNPAGGRWRWRDYLPSNEAELRELRRRAIENRPAKVGVAGFIDWVYAEMTGEPVSRDSATLGRYRRLLWELAQLEPEPSTTRGRRAGGPKGGKLLTAHNPRVGRYVKLSKLANDGPENARFIGNEGGWVERSVVAVGAGFVQRGEDVSERGATRGEAAPQDGSERGVRSLRVLGIEPDACSAAEFGEEAVLVGAHATSWRAKAA